LANPSFPCADYSLELAERWIKQVEMPAAIAALNLIVRSPGINNFEKPYAALGIVIQ
jgi:hypothetical protein